MSTIAYTFRTSPSQNELKQIFPDIFILGKIKQDLDKLFNKILATSPKLIIGLADSKTHSKIESLTINKFNKKKIDKNGKEGYLLDLSDNLDFNLSKKSSSSFCNYSMYKIKQFLEINNLNIPFMFFHINNKDIY